MGHETVSAATSRTVSGLSTSIFVPASPHELIATHVLQFPSLLQYFLDHFHSAAEDSGLPGLVSPGLVLPVNLDRCINMSVELILGILMKAEAKVKARS